MDYQRFKEELCSRLQTMAGKEAEVRVTSLTKVNDRQAEGLVMWKKGETVAPTIPLKPLFDSYCDGESVEELADKLMGLYQRCSQYEAFNCEPFSDPAYVLDNLLPRLIGKDGNEQLLEEAAHTDYLNLAVIYYCCLDDPQRGKGGVMVRNAHMEEWKLTLEQIHEAALRNAWKKDPVSICTMQQLLEELLFMQGADVRLNKDEEPAPLYVVTSKGRSYGAFWITQSEVLEELGDRIGGDYYVLPSSLHECLAAPAFFGLTADRLWEMVVEVNQTEVVKGEQLSDSVYYYERGTGRLQIAAGNMP